MDKNTKNIVLVVILILLIISSYFTSDILTKSNFIPMQNIRNIDETNETFNNQVTKPSNKIDNNETDINETRDFKRKRSDSKEKFRRQVIRKNKINERSNNFRETAIKEKNNNIYYALFALENIFIGAIIVILVINNKNKRSDIVKLLSTKK